MCLDGFNGGTHLPHDMTGAATDPKMSAGAGTSATPHISTSCPPPIGSGPQQGRWPASVPASPPASNAGSSAKAPATAGPKAPASAAPSGNGTTESFSGATPNGPLSQEESDKLGVQTTNALMKDFGFTKEQAAGIVGNLSHESAGMNPHVNEFVYSGYQAGDPRNFGKPVDNVYGYGWAQWSADRKTAYLDFAKQNGMEPGSPKANYAFLSHELKTTESATVGAVKATKSVDEAAVAFRTVYERAAMPNDQGRLAAAHRIYDMTA